jgi:glycosyltransferase involved in cell wall biosynthesis
MKLLALGFDASLFDADSPASIRHRAYGKYFEKLHVVVLTRRNTTERMVSLADNVHIHPVRATTALGVFISAFHCCRTILRSGDGWVISAQDPFESGLVAYVVSVATGVPFQVQEHGDFFSTPHWRRESLLNRLRYQIGLLLVRRAHSVRVVSNRIRSTLIARGVSPERIVVTPVYTDVQSYRDAEPDQELEKLRQVGETLFLTQARFVPQKNLDMLLRAFGQLHASGVKARLVLIGQGPMEDTLRALAHQVAPGAIDFLPWTNTPERTIKAADVYVLSSNYEGWARVAIEALAAGTPIVMTDVGCAGEVVHNEESGLVVPVGDVEAFAEQMRRLATDKELYAKLRDRGRGAVQDLPSLNESAEAYVASLEQAVGEK